MCVWYLQARPSSRGGSPYIPTGISIRAMMMMRGVAQQQS